MPEAKFTINLDLPVPLFRWLTAKATKENQSRNALVVALLEQAMEQERVKA